MSLSLNIRAGIETPAKKRSYNEQLFTRVASEYDLATRAMSLGRDRVWKRRLVELLPNIASPNCVDLACGTGDVILELNRRYPAGCIAGVDITPAMIDVARGRCRGENTCFIEGDMCRTSLPDNWADIVTGSYALRNAPVLDEALVEVRRILKPGGHAAFLDFAKSPIPWRQALQIPLLRCWGGLWGILIHGGPEHAYIGESLRQFPDRVALRRLLDQHGFYLSQSEKRFGGMLEILVIEKRDELHRGAEDRIERHRNAPGSGEHFKPA